MPSQDVDKDQTEKDSQDQSVDNISWDDAFEEEKAQSASTPTPDGKARSAAKTDHSKKAAEFSELKKSDIVSTPSNLDFILDIPLQVTVELGRTTMPIFDLLQLGQGSIIELNKMAGEPLEILVNQKLIAKGEVVVVNEKFGIRLTDVISPAERVEKLG